MSSKMQWLLLVLAVWSHQDSLADPEVSSFDKPKTRVVGGSDAPKGAVKFLVSLRIPKYDNFHFCGGSIISDRWILSAAHCLSGRKAEELVAVADTLSRSKGGTVIKLNKLIVHEKYTLKKMEHDIALLRTTKKIEYNDNVQPISLPTQDAEAYTVALLSGWGFTDQTGKKFSDTLQWMNVTVYDIEKCKRQLARNSQNWKITNDNVCTITSYGKGSCQGDSGGGLAQDNKVIGIASWNIPCARGYPDVYTNVYTHKDWVKKTMDKNKP